jgi:PadR family transcriptional regulator, regulatory protein PadR
MSEKTLKFNNMNLENTKAQMRKGVLEYCILSILANNDAYASDIINELKQSKMIVVEGTMYPLLTRQKNAGLLSYRWEESQQGPPRKYYTLTEKGKMFLDELDISWQELITAVGSINQARSQSTI